MLIEYIGFSVCLFEFAYLLGPGQFKALLSLPISVWKVGGGGDDNLTLDIVLSKVIAYRMRNFEFSILLVVYV